MKRNKETGENVMQASNGNRTVMERFSGLKTVKYLRKKIGEPFVLSSLFDFNKRIV